MRCDKCGSKECCGGEMGKRIAELETERDSLRGALQEISDIPYACNASDHLFDAVMLAKQALEEK